MTTDSSFHIDCIDCKSPISFSLTHIESLEGIVHCQQCGKKYGFGDTTLRRQLQQFAALCTQVRKSEEILGQTSVAVNVGNTCVQVPFKLLLTRLKSTLDLTLQGRKLMVTFRSEPTSIQKEQSNGSANAT